MGQQISPDGQLPRILKQGSNEILLEYATQLHNVLKDLGTALISGDSPILDLR